MSQMATMAMGAALSALGNMSESERSQTQSAISQNVNVQITDSEAQKQKTGKTAEETLQSLNRDVANANQKLEKQDLTKAQERQEMAQTIGQISEDWLQFTVGDKLKEANKKRQEADAIEKDNPTKSAELKAQAQAIEAEYGLGSNLQMGVRAATAALQGLATGSVNQAAVGAASPYLNKLIKEQTGDNKEANLIAHAVLGAVEAHFTGNNATAGAVGALTAEAAAPLIMQTLYGTEKPENLTDSQKQNVANLSQIAAGLSGGLVGDSTGSFVAGAEIGKRAVENNFLSQSEYAELNRLMEKKILTPEEAIQYLLEKDKVSDVLLDKWQKTPDELTLRDQELLFKWVREYGNIPSQIGLLNTTIDSPKMKPDYSDLKLRAQRVYNYSGSIDGRLSDSLATGLSTIGTGGIGSFANTALSSIPKIGVLASKYPIVTEKVSNAVLSAGVTYASNTYTGQETTFSDLAWSSGTGFITGGMPVYKVIGINSVSSGLQASQKGEDPWYAAGASVIATSSGAAIGKGIEKVGYRLTVGDITRNKSYYEPQYRTKEAMELLNSEYKLHTKLGNIFDGIFSEFMSNEIKSMEGDVKKVIGAKDEK